MKAFSIILPIFLICSSRAQQDEYTTVDISNPTNDLNPGNLALTFNLQGQDIQIDLEQNKDVPNDIPIIIGQGGRMATWRDDSTNFATYIDRQNNASFILEHKKTAASGDFDTTMKGSFRHDNKDYVIEPAPQAARRRRSAEDRNVYKISLAPVGGVDFKQDTEFRDSGVNTTQYVREWFEFMKDNLTSPALEAIKQNYEVETMFFLDYAVYDKFYRLSTETSASARGNDAITNIRYYYAHIFNGISLRYRSIDYFDYSLSVRLVGMYIATTPLDSEWTFKPANRDPAYPRDFTHAYNALDDFEAWINLPHPELPSFDQASLFTGNQLFRGYNPDRSHSEITGLADIASVCGKLRASINQDNGLYATTQTATHEMGHNLGSYHDSQGNSCRFQDQYIMASAPTELTDSNYKNAFTFSYCSRNSFRDYILLLNLNNKNCMLQRGATEFSQGELDTSLLVLPGEKYTLEQQCKQVFGKESYYCGGHLKDLGVCRKMYCYDPRSRTCFGRTEQRAAAGTPCGNMKWCQSGDCVFNAKAPSGEEFCRNGDFKGRFLDGRTCHEITRDSPFECYKENVAGDCCESCARVMDDSNPDCKYGDKSTYCKSISSYDCYSKSTQEMCCKTCANIHTGKTGCEYGDKATWCPGSKLSSCYTYQDSTCCKTCADRRNNAKPNCPYGDKVSWCARQVRSRCYESNIKNQCCDTCERHETGITGCEYGDRSRYCSQSDCNSVTARQDCCYTCRNVFQQPTIRPETPSSVPVSPTCLDKASWCSRIRSSGCYSSDKTCCRTCSKFRTTSQDCKYGDMASWCSSYVKSIDNCQSETVKKTCCMSCMIVPTSKPATSRPETPPSNCKDKASWCATIPDSYCYNAVTEDTCCATCNRKKTGPAGCEYGDMRTWCGPQYCRSNRSLCCRTCG